ncbi:ANL family adenylate-forming protein [Aurantimicrobium minutum]|uniref:ANL family adenylate-forming protein n=1 Tax=Aurantimicrobium minutum TaxID=708131 RepID=UPI00247553F8|nr:fatty acid--CoA ligase family protein [Aurantimicrobium minutum]MDH6255415.1 long-chain acyl-CoA synthetase [Aurantimicrobium minutum]
MELIEKLVSNTSNPNEPFLIGEKEKLSVSDVLNGYVEHLKEIESGQVVALIGDFDAQSILNLLILIEKNTIVVPLTNETINDHSYFFETAEVDWVVEGVVATKRESTSQHNSLIKTIVEKNNPGLVLFSTGTTGRPKAILHDMSQFLARFETPRPALRTLGFLLFDHIGGLNTLLHTMFNSGLVISITDRSPSSVLEICRKYEVEALPTTPTFLRMLLISGLIPDSFPPCLKIVTYGTERMDQGTLNTLSDLLPSVDFRQTYGMSELGILRVKSKDRNSLFMKVGGEGVLTKVIDDVLHIYSPNRMLGYLNADSPFESDGWYNTKDIVETDGEYVRITGRTSDVINVGGLKFLASEVERISLNFDSVELVKVLSKKNPVTGEHVELILQVTNSSDFPMELFKEYLKQNLPSHMQPLRISFGAVEIGHRFKQK